MLYEHGRLTIMVMHRILSLYDRGPPPLAGASRLIAGGPLYAPADVLTLLPKAKVQPVTRNCANHIQDLRLKDSDTKDLVRGAVTAGRFIDSEWCEVSMTKTGLASWVAADAYTYTRRELIEAAHKEFDITYYIKFCIGKTGQILLLVSCHTSRDNWRVK